MTADGMNTYSYDAENRLYVVGNGNIHYLYDPEGMRVAVGAGRTEFRLVNQVGTLVANGDSQGNYVEGCLSGPFGNGQICTPGYDYTETHFTDKLRDQESNLDYFGARHFSSTLRLFISPI